MKLLGRLPFKVYLACSGGVDSIAVLHFLLNGRRDVELLFCHHGTSHSEDAFNFLLKLSKDLNVRLHTTQYSGDALKATEADWREFRYSFFNQFTDKPIITCHHLNDNIETFLLSEIKGTPKFIPYQRNNIIRPFLLTTKDDLISYAVKNKLNWVEDESNHQNNYDRNKIRNQVIPVLKQINPGLETTYYYKCLRKYTNDGIC